MMETDHETILSFDSLLLRHIGQLMSIPIKITGLGGTVQGDVLFTDESKRNSLIWGIKIFEATIPIKWKDTEYSQTITALNETSSYDDLTYWHKRYSNIICLLERRGMFAGGQTLMMSTAKTENMEISDTDD